MSEEAVVACFKALVRNFYKLSHKGRQSLPYAEFGPNTLPRLPLKLT